MTISECAIEMDDNCNTTTTVIVVFPLKSPGKAAAGQISRLPDFPIGAW